MIVSRIALVHHDTDSCHDGFVDEFTTLPPFLLRLSLREISSLCPLNCSFPVQKRSQPPDCETPSIRNFNANVRFKSTRNSSEYKYRNWRENFFKRKSLDSVLHLETKIINSKVSYFKLASIFFFFFFASIIDATREKEREKQMLN